VKFVVKNYNENHATVRRGTYPDGSTKLTVVGRYGQVLCDATVCLQDIGEYPQEGSVFIREYEDTEGSLRALQDAGVIGRTQRIIDTKTGTCDPLRSRPVHECRLLFL